MGTKGEKISVYHNLDTLSSLFFFFFLYLSTHEFNIDSIRIDILLTHDVIERQSVVGPSVHTLRPGMELYILGVGLFTFIIESRAYNNAQSNDFHVDFLSLKSYIMNYGK